MRYVGRRKKYYKSPPEDALLLTTCFDGSDLADSNAQPSRWPPSSGTAAGKSISDDEAELQLDDLVRASDAVGAIRRAAEDAAGKAPSSIDLADIGPYGTLLGQLAIIGISRSKRARAAPSDKAALMLARDRAQHELDVTQ